jgi:endonuclease-3
MAKTTTRKATKSKSGEKKTRLAVDEADAKRRVKKIIPILKKSYPEAKTALKFSSPLELLIATILSAQCTDTWVNMVTEQVFKKYRSVKDWAGADVKEIEEDIRTTGFFRNKAKSIKAACRAIADEHGGTVPGTLEQLVELPGVGRKTANVVLGNAFDTPAIVCDTHVIRLSRRLGLSEQTDAVKLEFDLAEIVPRDHWTLFSHLLIHHGRAVCRARKPACDQCPVAQFCPSANRPELW